MTPHWKSSSKLETIQKIQSGILVLIMHMKNLVQSLCNALPAFLSFTGYDYVVSFKRKESHTF